MIDIFAGPGGLGEGFSSFAPTRGSHWHPFELIVSAEAERSAHATLRLRSFSRILGLHGEEATADYFSYLGLLRATTLSPEAAFSSGRWQKEWQQAGAEALNLTLGQRADNSLLIERIKAARARYDELILIGGPPCQAYSLVGRARQRNVRGFRSKGDHRHFLYREYLELLAEFTPAVFIMENVKGILTSTVGGEELFSAIRNDLADPSMALGRSRQQSIAGRQYVLLPIHVNPGEKRTPDLVQSDPGRFVIRAERHGIPQARHRVIIMGVRADCLKPSVEFVEGLSIVDRPPHVGQALAGLPTLRSALSRQPDIPEAWNEAVLDECDRVARIVEASHPEVRRVLREVRPRVDRPRRSHGYTSASSQLASELRDGRQNIVLNHESRTHMKPDLGRYLFCAAFAEVYERSPKSKDFPKRLAPSHENWESGDFRDRFRVQLKGKPSSTITSHLSKDGHAFIHWDPTQCRSFTVREAARLQTFPDDYLFIGNRTQQYVQVGNAVPPMLAGQIARVVWDVLRAT